MSNDDLLKPTIIGKSISPLAIIDSRLAAKMHPPEVLYYPSAPPEGTEPHKPLTQEEYDARRAQLLAAAGRRSKGLSTSQVYSQERVMAVFDALYREVEAKFKLRVEFDPDWASEPGHIDYGKVSAIPFVGFATSVDPEGRRMVFAPSPVGGNMVFMDTNTSGLEVTGYMPSDENDIAVPGVEVKPYDLNALDPWLEGLVYAYNSLWV